MEIIFRAEARAEFDNALEFYVLRAPDAAANYLEDYDRVAVQLLQFPNAGTRVARSARRLTFPRFPYQLIYRVEGDDIVIYAVAHQRQRPGYWRKRVGPDR